MSPEPPVPHACCALCCAQGYTFETEANGHGFTVRVPVGGVEEGQTFSVPFPAGDSGFSGA